jgi:type I restriction enzyme M protein
VKGGKKDLDSEFDVKRLRKSWTSIWNHIWGGTVEDNAKFENFNKLILAKIYDERNATKGEAYRFQTRTVAGKLQTADQVALDIDLLYRRAFSTYITRDQNAALSEIHGIDFSKLSPNVILQCVNELSEYSFIANRLRKPMRVS